MKYVCLVYLEEKKLRAVPDTECAACGKELQDRGILVAAEALQPVQTGKTVRVRQGKGRKEREVPLNASARRALRTYLEPRGALRPEAPLFLSGRGGAMAVRSIQA